MNGGILTSLWGNLNPHLIAHFYEVDRDGKRIDPDVTVKAPLTDSNFEIALNWSSPFENQANLESSTLQQLLQSGALQPLAQKADSAFGTKLSALAAGVEGRSSVTKLNSTQVFVGEQPAKFNVTALFRAWKDPQTEVHDPFDQLMKWALPIELAKDGLLLSRLATDGLNSSVPFPSKSPTLLAVKYKDCTYWPLVIESISKDTNAPVGKGGKFVELSVPMLLTTLTALDRQDWSNFTGR
jgi:hypothetical protein